MRHTAHPQGLQVSNSRKITMMTLEARKLDLMQRLSVVEDEATLHIVDEVLSTNTGHTDWQLSDEQKQFVKASITELDAGMGIPHEEVMNEIIPT